MNGPLLAAILALPAVELARITAAYRTAKRRDDARATARKESGQ